jgi:DeoR family glycerol-3-phosphate regulon repressor
MFAEERQNIILTALHKNGKVEVKELSRKFKVTEDCIRKDLSILEKQGALKRVYGGAVKSRISVHNFDVKERKEKNREIKCEIASKAITLIKNNDMIFLDISTSNIELAKLLVKSNLNVTVVTNMVDVMLELSIESSVKVIFIGGSFNRGKDGFVGSMAISAISNFKFDIAFMGAVGVDLDDNSVFTYVVDDGITKKAVINSSKKKYIIIETEKFNMDGTFKYAQVDDFDGIITENKPNDDELNILKEYKLELIY